MPQQHDVLEIKAFGPLEIKDEERGQVEAIVATLNVVDRDGDVILPGAIPSGAKVKLSGYAHDVVLAGAPPVGIGTITEEEGKAIFRGRFFTTTERGREAFRTVKELGEDGEWSFGFPKRVKTETLTDEWREKGAKRLIAGLEPVEASPVFRGAGIGTRTTHVKAEDASLSDMLEAVNDALWKRNEAASTSWWAQEIFEDFVIVRAGSKLFRVPYTRNDDGSVSLGDGVEVEVEYREVKAESSKEEPPMEKPTEPVQPAKGEGEAKTAESAEETKAEAAGALAQAGDVEFLRFQQTRRRLRVM